MTRIITVTSGKAGVGKSHLSVNLALQCARQGLRTCLFDADLGLANVNLLLQLAPRLTLADVIAGEASLRDIMLRGQFDFDIIPGSAGTTELADLSPQALNRLAGQLRLIDGYDLVIFDTGSDSGRNVMTFVTAAAETLLVITPEAAALTDAYALVKALQREHYRGSIRVVVNQAQSETQAMHTFNKFREVVRVYQNIDLPLLGWVPHDPQVVEAGRQQRPVSVHAPHDGAAMAFSRLADQLIRTPIPEQAWAVDEFLLRLTGVELEAEISEPTTSSDFPTPPVAAVEPERPRADAPALDDRLSRIELGLEVVTRELERLQPQRTTATVAAPAPVVRTEKRSERHGSGDAQRRMGERRIGRRAGEESGPARFVRNSQRASPIDSLQLRRVVGRMLAKAAPEQASNQGPLQVAVEHVQIDAGNQYNLRPGRYTQVSLQCLNIGSPDGFVEEIFSNCAIAGCKVRQLGSHIRYWVTTEQDGCILLDGDDPRSQCLRVYLAAGGNGLMLEAASAEEAPREIASLRRVSSERRVPRVGQTELLAKYPHQRLDMGQVDGEPLLIYRFLRHDRGPLVCAFSSADGDATVSPNRDHAPKPGSGD